MGERTTLVGKKFGMLTVIAEAPPKSSRRYLCRCDCGAESIVTDGNLKRGITTSCGCKRKKDLTGQRIGKLTVIERSDRYGPKGAQKTRLWKCQCDCGAITYKATSTLTNPDISMCKDCAGHYAVQKAKEAAGFVGGTQISKIKNCPTTSNNASGHRGVYFESKTGKYRARLEFCGRTYSFGSYSNIDDAIKARQRGEEEIYGKFLEQYDN